MLLRRAAFSIFAIAIRLAAHHSTAPYDMTREASVTGVVTRVYWANPHAYLYLDVEGASGKEAWAMEIESPNLLRHHGWAKDTVKAGDKITCNGARAKDPESFRMKCFQAILPDGRTLRAQ